MPIYFVLRSKLTLSYYTIDLIKFTLDSRYLLALAFCTSKWLPYMSIVDKVSYILSSTYAMK